MTIDKGIIIRNIFYMLTYAFQQLRHNNYEKIDKEDFENIYDLFAEILSKGVSHLLKQGLHKEYISKHDVLPTVRGKIDINATIKFRMQRVHKIACDYDELSENNLFNQILKSTMLLLFSHADVRKETKRILKQILIFFVNIDTIDLSIVKWDTLKFDRNTQTYQMLLNICYFIYDGYILTTESGEFKMKQFSDEHMCKLYERFILEYYKRHYPELNPRSSQIVWDIVEEESSLEILPNMQSDIMLSNKERTLIIDAKYYGRTMQYNFEKASIHSNNLYQIHTYVTNHDKTSSGKVDGMLLYAKTDEKQLPNGEMKLQSGNTIYFKTLNLDGDFNIIKEQLDGFAQNIVNKIRKIIK